MRWIFLWGFCRNRFLLSPLHYLSSRSKFGFEFAEIFVIEKRLSDSPSWGVDDSLIRRVVDSPTRRVGESANEFLKEKSLRRWVRESATHRVRESATLKYYNKGKMTMIMRSPTRWVGESLSEYFSKNSLTRRVVESRWWVWESLLEIVLNLSSIFRTLNG